MTVTPDITMYYHNNHMIRLISGYIHADHRLLQACGSKQQWHVSVGNFLNENENCIKKNAWARYAMWFTPFEEKGTIIRSVSKPSCRNSGAGPYDTTTGPRWGVYNTRWRLNKYTSCFTLHCVTLHPCNEYLHHTFVMQCDVMQCEISLTMWCHSRRHATMQSCDAIWCDIDMDSYGC